MVNRFLCILLTASLLLTGCLFEGTETGNPTNDPAGAPTDGDEETESYSNGDFGVSTEHDNGWSVTEVTAGIESSPADAGDGSDPVADCVGCDDGASSGIDTSLAPSTEFSDGTSTVTIFYVRLAETPATLLAYLQELFPGRSFETFENEFIPGLTFDNEYYFLDDTLLLYIVTNLSDANDGAAKAQTILDSLRFD